MLQFNDKNYLLPFPIIVDERVFGHPDYGLLDYFKDRESVLLVVEINAIHLMEQKLITLVISSVQVVICDANKRKVRIA
ncbi:hypothetical protein QUQ58_004794 [Escherichia coli]|nr:hypothetical protein [Escherichia coli]